MNTSPYGLNGFSPQTNRSIVLWGLLIPILVLLFIFGREALPYMSGLLGAITLFSILRKQMCYLTRKRWPRWLAATLLTLEALFFFLIPLSIFVTLVVDLISNGPKIDFTEWYNQLNEFTANLGDRFDIDLLQKRNNYIEQALPTLAKMGESIAASLMKGVYSMTVNSVVLLFILYYMLYSREDFENAISELLPFSPKNKQILFAEIQRVIAANAVGIPLLAIIQGIVAYIGYLIFGVENPLFYALLTTFATIIPMAGTMLVYLPLGLVMGFSYNNWGMGIGVILYGFLIIGSVDNVVRFLLQKRLADIHPLITVFGVIFGLSIFGFWGIIFGPLLLSLLILLLKMFRYDYIPGSTAVPHMTTKPKSIVPEGLVQRIGNEKKKFLSRDKHPTE